MSKTEIVFDASVTRDRLVRAILPTHGLRVVAALTTGVGREAARRHGAIAGAAVALARGATAGALLATLTKDRERMTAEIKGDGPLGKLMVDANADGDVRVYIANPGALVPVAAGAHVDLSRALGPEGLVRVARDLGLREVVSGQTPLAGGEIDTDLEHYLSSSEQVPSVLGCEALLAPGLDLAVAGGILVQTLPNSTALPLLAELRAHLRNRALADLLAQGPADPTALARATLALVPDLAEDLVPLDQRPLRFFCPCSKERALGTLAVLTHADLAEMAAEGNGAEVVCEFCRARHEITPSEVARLELESRSRRPD